MATNPANDVLIRAIMTSDTGLVADEIVNDFAMHNDSGINLTRLATLMAAVSDFYRVSSTSVETVGSYISTMVDRSATHRLVAYRIQTDGSLDSPIVDDPWLGPDTFGGTQGLPGEVAGVLSFQADQSGILEESGATRPRARRRGRLYIGPLGNNAIANTTPPFLLADAFNAALRRAAVALKTATGGDWSVWSRADQVLRPVHDGWTDNAPDTQRRRGPVSTARVVWGP